MDMKPIVLSLVFALTAPFLSLAQALAPAAHTIWLPTVMRPAFTPGNPVYEGEATWYYASGGGACSFDASPDDLMVAAMNAAQYGTADYCGAYVHVTGPRGEVTVRIVDLCPGCHAGDLDLSREAFSQIANLSQGRVSITWQVVSPDVSGPIAYCFRSGSSQWWTAVQIRNHRNPVAKLEYRRTDGQWAGVARTSYNYFVQTSPGMGTGPYTFRVTDSYGHVLEDANIPLTPGGTVNGAGQFPAGP